MFYQGDLQSGIKLAIEQSKLVACFVRDDGPESDVWEEKYLRDINSSRLFSDKTVLLRLQSGSPEAGFLAAIYPLPKSPTLVIQNYNGQLKEYLTSGISEKDFIARVQLALDDGSTLLTETVAGCTQNVVPDGIDQGASSSSISQPIPAEEGQSAAVSALVVETSADMERKKKEQNATEKIKKTKKTTKSAAKKEVLEKAAHPDSKKAADMKYALMQKKRQQDAQNERTRILKLVEDDKAERRARENLRKEQAKVANESEDMPQSSPGQANYGSRQATPADRGTTCAIQIRLFDGATIRSRFSSQNTLRQHIRGWIDDQRVDGDTPYSFKQVLTPQPNKTISISEEEMSLYSLDLLPSTTFILVPIKEYASAYEASAGNYISRGLSTGLTLVSSGIGLVSGSLGNFLGGNSLPERQTELQIGHSAPETGVGNVRTLRAHGETSHEHQFYNGNALNFEPRVDDVEKDE